MKGARRVRRAATGNGPGATLAPRPWPTQLRPGGQREPPGVTRRAHGLRPLPPPAARAGAAREQRLAVGLADRVGLAGQQRLVDLELPLLDRAVHDDLVPGSDPHEVAPHHLLGAHLPLRALAQHPHAGAREELEAVELAACAQLLDGGEGRVDQAETDTDQGVVVAPEAEQGEADDEQDVVVEGEDAGAQDARRGPGAPGDGRVGLPATGPVPDLARTESHGSGRGRHFGILAEEPERTAACPSDEGPDDRSGSRRRRIARRPVGPWRCLEHCRR